MRTADCETERLRLSCLTPEDVTEKYVSWLADPQVNEYLETRFVQQSIDDVRGFVSEINESEHSVLFGIFLKENNQHIGNIKLGPIDHRHGTAVVGFLIGDKTVWGKGFAREAIATVARFAFGELGLQKMWAGCYESNLGSLKAMLSCGFEREGVLRNQVYGTGKQRENTLILGLFPEELREVTPRL